MNLNVFLIKKTKQLAIARFNQCFQQRSNSIVLCQQFLDKVSTTLLFYKILDQITRSCLKKDLNRLDKNNLSEWFFILLCKNKRTSSLIQDLRLPAHRQRQAGFIRCRRQLGDDRLRRSRSDLNHWNSCRRLHENTNTVNNLILNQTPKV